jgi:hypothetical protein
MANAAPCLRRLFEVSSIGRSHSRDVIEKGKRYAQIRRSGRWCSGAREWGRVRELGVVSVGIVQSAAFAAVRPIGNSGFQHQCPQSDVDD